MIEADWDRLLIWNNDPEVLYYAEGDDVTSRTLDEIQSMYRAISQNAFCFITEADGVAIGEGWLQTMNLARVLQQYPDEDCRRIDLIIGEKTYWNQGIGTVVIRLLTTFGFQQSGATLIYIPEVADYNARSRRAFEKVGYQVVQQVAQSPGNKAVYGYDLALTREQFLAATALKSISG